MNGKITTENIKKYLAIKAVKPVKMIALISTIYALNFK